ncbi:MAG: hypothetical protein AAF891_00140 [Pseudomonadota bacterium]
MDMLPEARRLLQPAPPTDIQCGSRLRFEAALRDLGASLAEPKSAFSEFTFGGVPVRVNRNLPKNMIVILQGERIVQIINLDEQA